MAARWSAWIVWAALAASLVAWGLRLLGRSDPVPAHAQSVVAAQAVQGDVLRLFAASHEGSQPMAEAAPEAASRFQVLGVVAGLREGSPGWALIAVDGKAPRPVAVGRVVDGEWILQSVTQSAVAIGPRGGDAALRLELPLLPPPATGSLTSAVQESTGMTPAGERTAALSRPAVQPRIAQNPVLGAPTRLGVPAGPDGQPIDPTAPESHHAQGRTLPR